MAPQAVGDRRDPVRSLGRWPTLGELIEYYSREDIRAVLYYQARRWKVLMAFRDSAFLEPRDERDTGEILVRKLRELADGAREDERLPRYPTIHVLRDRGDRAPVRWDLTTEDDPESWRQAFSSMARAADVLEACGAYYQLKFSGHRSLHLRIPAEAFPVTFRGEPTRDQFAALERRVKSYLPPTGHSTIGLRAVYSTHPAAGLVSVPLRREELACFGPWMASPHAVVVDWGWFQVPEDAADRNAEFLARVFEAPSPAAVSLPATPGRSPRAYRPDPALPRDQVLASLASDHLSERRAAVGQALMQSVQVSASHLNVLLHDPDVDTHWFALEIALRQRSRIDADQMASLLTGPDDYARGLVLDLLRETSWAAAALAGFLTRQTRVSRESGAVARALGEVDWPLLPTLPRRVASPLDGGFRHLGSLCGSCLALGWGLPIEPVFGEAARWLHEQEGSAERKAECLRELELLMALRCHSDTVLFTAAEELRRRGCHLEGLVLALLDAGTFVSQSAMRLLTLPWFPDATGHLIRCLGRTSGVRRRAVQALLDIGPPAQEPLLRFLESTRVPRQMKKALDVLGKLGDAAVVPVIRRYLVHPDESVREVAAAVLARNFNILVPVEPRLAGTPTGVELEDPE